MDAAAAARLGAYVADNGIRRVLITNLRLKDLSGTELIVVDLARCLVACGCEVHACAATAGPPVTGLLEAIGVRCHAIDQDIWLSELPDAFDLVVGHHWVVLGHVLFERRPSFRSLVLASYSLTEPNEALWLFLDEADRILFNSNLNCATQTRAWPDAYTNKSMVFPNSVSEAWLLPESVRPEPPARARRILIVSNHVPGELLQAAELLRADGIDVDHVGRPGRERIITAAMIDDVDGVVSIGHTVQKAMARGKPVYVYDHYGGCGWIGDRLREQFDNNFSGLASGAIKTAETIRAEILEGYQAEAERVGERLTFVRRRCRLEENLLAVLEDIRPTDARRIEPADFFAGQRLARLEVSRFLPEHAVFRSTSNVFSRPMLARELAFEASEDASGLHMVMNGLPRRVRIGADVRDIVVGGVMFDPADPFTALTFVRDDGVRFDAIFGRATPGLVPQFDRAPFAASAGFRILLAVAAATRSFEVIGRRRSDGTDCTIGMLEVSPMDAKAAGGSAE